MLWKVLRDKGAFYLRAFTLTHLKRNRLIVVVIVALIIAIALSGALTVSHLPGLNQKPITCMKPPNGFLVITSSKGFNDSVDNGAPQVHWPVMTVKQGATVNLVVCNTDYQAHALLIQHYLDSDIQVLRSNQTFVASFVANQAGTFQIYEGLFTTNEVYDRSGELVVSP